MKISKNTNLVVNICRIFYIRFDQVTFVSGTDRFHKIITFPQGKKWKEIYFTLGTANFTENDKVEDSGQLYDQLLKLTIPGEDQSNTNSMEDLIPPLIMMIKTIAGDYRIFGCQDNPVHLINNRSTGTKTNSELSFTCLAQEPAWWHDTPVNNLPD